MSMGLKQNFERAAWKKGFRCVVGMDEAGRGPLAGPVAVGLVLIPRQSDFSRQIAAQDSKLLTPKRRRELFELITARYPWAVGSASAREIDKVGIMGALRLAIRRVWRKIKAQPNCGAPDFILADYGLPVDILKTDFLQMVRGDGQIFSVACASIVAKVWRDDYMSRQDKKYPRYGFAQHKGYGTRAHYAALKKYGICPLHRVSYGLGDYQRISAGSSTDSRPDVTCGAGLRGNDKSGQNDKK